MEAGIYTVGFAVVTLAMFALWGLAADSSTWMYVLVTALAGLGLGVIPTISTLVAQFAVPKRLLGVAVGAIFFFQMLGIAVAPAILGLLLNNAPSLESGLKLVFLAGALTMLVALLMILTIPEISMEAEASEENKPIKVIPVEA